MKCFKRLSKFYILHFTTHWISSYKVILLTRDERVSRQPAGRVSRKFLNLIVSSYILKLSDK